MSLEDVYRQVSEIMVGAGGTPVPITDTLIKIIKRIVSVEETDFVLVFKDQKSQTLDQLLENSNFSEAQILKMTENLAKKGVIFNQPNRSGVVVYRLLPLINVGVFEYTFMQKLVRSEENRELAQLFVTLFKEIKGIINASYDDMLGFMAVMPAVDRTIPFRDNKSTGKSTVIQVNKSIEPVETYLQTKNVVDLIEKFDEIAVGHCFCRHHKDMIDEPCKQTDSRESCFTFGKSARYTTEQNFMRMIDKKEALEILRQAEADGLVHKAYHPNFNVAKDETSVCNCCKCCCGNSIVNQIGPIINAANYLAIVDPEACTGCGICSDYCHSNAIEVGSDNVSVVDETKCLGCGVCAHFCPEDAIRLTESDRIVRIAPPPPEKNKVNS